MTDRPARRDRGVSVVVNYVIVLSVVSLLGAGLFVTATDYVQAQQSSAIRSEFQDVGNELAADLSTADRLARSGTGEGTIALRSDLPDRVAGSTYRVAIRSVGDDRYEIVLRSTDPGVIQRVTFRSRTPVAEESVDGGPVAIRAEIHDGTAQPVVVDDA